MRDGDGTPESVMGWGQIAKELGVHPGIGSATVAATGATTHPVSRGRCAVADR